MTKTKEALKWILLLVCVAAILYATLGLGYGIRIGQAANAEGNWIRQPHLQQVPVEQQGMSAEEVADLDTVKILHRYKVTPDIVGIVYHDEKSQMDCHVVMTASLLDLRGVSCSPTTRRHK